MVAVFAVGARAAPLLMSATGRGASAPFPKDENTPADGGSLLRRALWLLALTALAVVSNAFAPKLFSGHSLVLGAVFYWIAVPVVGPLPALLTLAAAMATLAVKWGQPFSALLMALEGLAVGLAWRRGRNPLLADLGFWVLIGTPLSWFIYHRVYPIPQPSLDQALWVQPINGVLAVWIAFLVLDQIAILGTGGARRAEPDFRTVLLRRYVAFGTFPVVIATLVVIGSFERRSIADAGESLQTAAAGLAHLVERQVADAATTVTEFAARQREADWSDDPATLERSLETLHARFGLFVSLIAVDRAGRVVAAAPATAQTAASRREARPSVADRGYYRLPMATARPYVSGAFRGRGLGNDLIFAVSAPMLDAKGVPFGVIEGSLLVESLEEILRRECTGRDWRAILTDSTRKVIARQGFDEPPLRSLAGTTLGNVVNMTRAAPLRVTLDKGSERVSFLSTQVSIPELGWTLTLQREWRAVIRPVIEAYTWSLLIAVTTVLVASLFTTWSLRDFLRAWRDLIAFSRAPSVQASALRKSARVRLPLEFSELIRNLTGMADRLEAERRGREELLSQLESRVRERTAELQAAVALAQSADRAKSAFLATVSHELRTPLTAIVTSVRLLRMMPAARTDAETRTLATLENSSRALMSVISDVLDYSRLEGGTVRMEAAPFQPAALTAEVASILAPEAQRAGVEIHSVQEHSPALTWTADVKRVKQVLINLAGNAVKFAPGGRVEIISWITENPRQLWFSVADTGPDIPADRLETVFEAFVQLENNPVQSQAGTGLGLSISRRLVELMGGKIRAVDTAGRGARFEFWLPEVPPPSAPSANPFPPTAQ